MATCKCVYPGSRLSLCVSESFKSVSKRHQLLIFSSTDINYILVDSEEDALFLENSNIAMTIYF